MNSIPFAWQDKRALRLIREKCQEPASALAVYCALSVAASDEEMETFQTTHKWLSSLSGFGERTVRSRLHELAKIGAVGISTPKLKAPSTYTLRPIGNDCRTFGTGCRTFGNGRASSVAAIRRKRRNGIQKPSKNLTSSDRSGVQSVPASQSELMERLPGESFTKQAMRLSIQ